MVSLRPTGEWRFASLRAIGERRFASLRAIGWTVPSRRTIGQTLCLIPVVLAPLLGGTAGRPYTLVIAGLCGLVAIFVGVHEQLRRRAVPLSGFAIFLGLALLLCGLQLVPLPPGLRASLAPGSDTLLRQILSPLQGYPAHALPSGAGHDAVAMAVIAPVAMLFVRCQGGISHHPAESVAAADVAVGIETLSRFLGLLAATGQRQR